MYVCSVAASRAIHQICQARRASTGVRTMRGLLEEQHLPENLLDGRISRRGAKHQKQPTPTPNAKRPPVPNIIPLLRHPARDCRVHPFDSGGRSPSFVAGPTHQNWSPRPQQQTGPHPKGRLTHAQAGRQAAGVVSRPFYHRRKGRAPQPMTIRKKRWVGARIGDGRRRRRRKRRRRRLEQEDRHQKFAASCRLAYPRSSRPSAIAHQRGTKMK